MQLTREGCNFGSYAQVRADPLRYQRAFHDLVFAEPGIRGRVLDIGCADRIPPPLVGINRICKQLDGVDSAPTVLKNRAIKDRWHCTFETADIPAETYDFAYAFNVVEHVPDAHDFLEHVLRVLKPGCAFWTLTPNRNHPFCPLARAIERLGLKDVIRRSVTCTNEYPSYYRLNSARQVLRALRGLPATSARFVYLSCTHWSGYFPKPLRWAPALYDRVIGCRFPRFMSVVAFRIQKAPQVEVRAKLAPITKPAAATKQ